MAEPIVINLVNSRKPINQQMLSGCYFYQIEDNKFSFFSKADVLLASGLRNGRDFEFNLGPFTWTVRNFLINTLQASGNWEADVPRIPVIEPPTDHDAEDEGSFQAQAGGHVLEENAAAASSY